ncbi:MAG: DNA methylase [Pseudomonas sp.]|nr:DNA methylase [Pseudomonas sp.]QDP67273.1 MAG: putative modification methylase [Prokaryotic dsDNA virus sp.]|tara:strand:+ start:4627 stop:5619 length:993 start_codon:yes stop_codon:yes gene_type:complete
MKKAEYQGAGWAIHNSDCIEGMWAMPESSVDCAIFSPPFGDLFVYSDSERDLGNAGEGQAFINQYKFFAEALTRVLAPGRIACVHCTDLPMRKGKHGAIGLQDFSGDLIKAHTEAGLVYHGRATIWKDPVVEMQRTKALGLLYKQIRKDSSMNRVGMPDYMLFFRKDAPNPRPVQHAAPGDTATAVKIAREWLVDLRRHGLCASVPDDAVLAELMKDAEFDVMEWQRLASPVWMDIDQGKVLRRVKAVNDEKHVCPLQLDVIARCLRLYTKPGDVVMDPFNGIGSTGYEAVRNFRRYIGFELKPEYAAQANANLLDAERQSGDLFGIAAE